jgi:hypothetical protein
MERPPMFIGQQNKYCLSGCTTKRNIQIQYNPHQNSNDILHRTRKLIPQIAKGLLSKKAILEVPQVLLSNYTIKPK